MEVKTIFRTVELMICLVLFILWFKYDGFVAHATLSMPICGTIFGFFFIIAILMLHEYPEYNEITDFSIVIAIFLLICGGLTVGFLPDDKDGRLTHFIAAALFFANGIIFLIDFIIELKK